MFARWRQTIKQALSALWVGLLQSGPAAYAAKLHGRLSTEFLATPQAAARVIAEAMLLREEYCWARNLGDVDPNEDVAERCSSRGLHYMAKLDGYALAGAAEFVVEDLRSARNFHVCGRRLDATSPAPMAITISVNGIQEQTFPLGAGPNVNVGIVDPILLQGLANRFTVTAHFVDAQDEPVGDASKALLITHLVVDNRMVSRL